ncbi:hypothetical protein ACFLUU_10915, partial [Chloroflexota bacterium]
GELDIHIAKYGRFGLSFTKHFIAMKGGKPLTYIPKFGTHPVGQSSESHYKYFDKREKHYLNLFEVLSDEVSKIYPNGHYSPYLPSAVRKGRNKPKDLNSLLKRVPSIITGLRNFFDVEFFSYLKFFDHSLDDEEKHNYYFEREWRVIGKVQFEIKDVKRVFIPEGYAKNFRNDCPEYYGQVTFTEI